MSSESVIDVSIDLVDDPTIAMRTVIDVTNLEDLSRSIQRVGVIQPLILKKIGERFEIVAGHRRFIASKMAGKHIVPAIVRDVEDGDADLIKMSENSFREDINPVDEGLFFLRLKEKYSYTNEELARHASRSVPYVADRINIVQCDAFIVSALQERLLNISQAKEIARAKTEGIRRELVRVTVENGASTASLRLMRSHFEQAAGLLTPQDASLAGPVVSSSPAEPLYVCPACMNSYRITDIYPISVCVTCHNGIMDGIKSNRG